MDKNAARTVKKEFGLKYAYSDVVGTIEGGDADLPVMLTSISLSSNSAAERTREFGCDPAVEAILAEWVPCGMTYSAEHEETGVDPAKIPPRHTWYILPKSFHGLPVCYKRGHMAFAL